MDISLTFISLIGCIVLLHLQRILLFGRLLLQRFHFSRFNYSLMWVGLVLFSFCAPIPIILLVGCKLGMHYDWLHRAPILAISLLILQIWCQNKSAQQICALYCKCFIYWNIWSNFNFSEIGSSNSCRTREWDKGLQHTLIPIYIKGIRPTMKRHTDQKNSATMNNRR